MLHVRYSGRDYGTAVPLVIGRHAHPKTGKHDPPPALPGPGGPAYLNLLDAAHGRQLSGALNYRTIITPATPEEDNP